MRFMTSSDFHPHPNFNFQHKALSPIIKKLKLFNILNFETNKKMKNDIEKI